MPAHHHPISVDVLIFGGGIAGLWLLDELHRRGDSALLLETGSLGQGQTVASQGILHGGLKYTLQGLLTNSASQIRDMPQLWRDCLAGRCEPDLTQTPVRSQFCHLWRTDGVTSKLGMIGAKFGLRIAPQTLTADRRPAALTGCPGTVARLDEQVISPAGLIANLAARHRERLLQIRPDGFAFHIQGPGDVQAVTIAHPETHETVEIEPRRVVFTAGAGNAELRKHVGLPAEAMQIRPLHMVLLRGDLPELNGHCVDGRKTRVTITSDVDSTGRRVWQVGGQSAEDGVALSATELIRHVRAELESVIPGIDLAGAEWATYRANRAEGATRGGRRPDGIQIRREGNTVTAWPTKLVLAPKLAEEICQVQRVRGREDARAASLH